MVDGRDVADVETALSFLQCRTPVLYCIAGAGRGSYYDVDSSEELAASLEKLATRAARPFSEIGEPVADTAQPEDAPEIGSGDWLDQIGAEQTTRNYLVRREMLGSSLHVPLRRRRARSRPWASPTHPVSPARASWRR